MAPAPRLTLQDVGPEGDVDGSSPSPTSQCAPIVMYQVPGVLARAGLLLRTPVYTSSLAFLCRPARTALKLTNGRPGITPRDTKASRLRKSMVRPSQEYKHGTSQSPAAFHATPRKPSADQDAQQQAGWYKLQVCPVCSMHVLRHCCCLHAELPGLTIADALCHPTCAVRHTRDQLQRPGLRDDQVRCCYSPHMQICLAPLSWRLRFSADTIVPWI